MKSWRRCNDGYRVCFVLSFLSFVGLSNRSSNKLLLRLFLQRRNDQFGDVGIFLQQAVRLFRRVIQRLLLRHISPFLEEIRPSYPQELLTLSTCGGRDRDARLVVVAIKGFVQR